MTRIEELQRQLAGLRLRLEAEREKVAELERRLYAMGRRMNVLEQELDKRLRG